MIKVAITDDHPLIIKGIKELIDREDDMQLVAEFTNGKDCISSIGTLDINVFLLDYNLPDLDGDQICKVIKSTKPSIQVLLLSSFDDTGVLKRAMAAGATGYVTKTVKDEILLDAIRTVHNGSQFIQRELQDKLINESLNLKKTVGEIPKLTRREKEILEYICDEMTTSEIADKLFLSPKTVETHRINLLHKLNVKNTAGLVKLALKFRLV